MIISRTPLRVSFFGGGTDLKDYYQQHEGAVVSLTINKYIHVWVRPNYVDDAIIVRHFDVEKVFDVNQIQHGIIREALKLTKVKSKVDIVICSDIPFRGTGLGSSSALTVGLLNALFAYQGKVADPFELAELASYIEIDLLGEPIGKQDQYAAAFGGLREYTFCKDSSVKVTPIDLDNKGYEILSSHIILFHTGVERKASHVLSDQKSKIGQNLNHLHELKRIAVESKGHFANLKMIKIGELLNLNWENKKKLSNRIQNEIIE